MTSFYKNQSSPPSTSTSRLQQANNQYESLLIRAGEIIEHGYDSDHETSFDRGSGEDIYIDLTTLCRFQVN